MSLFVICDKHYLVVSIALLLVASLTPHCGLLSVTNCYGYRAGANNGN